MRLSGRASGVYTAWRMCVRRQVPPAYVGRAERVVKDGTRPTATSRDGDRGSSTLARASWRFRAGVVMVALVILVVALASWLWFLWRALHAPVGRYDFSSYYAAAAALRINPHADIYAAAVIAQSGAANHVQVQPPLPYTYPPLLAITLVPLTLVPFTIAARIWLLTNAGIWLACTLFLARELHLRFAGILARGDAFVSGAAASRWSRMLADPAPVVALAVAAVLCLPFAPAEQTVLLGQIDLLVLLFLTVVPWLTRHGHERWVGGAIAIAAMLKLTPALLLLYLALRRRWVALSASLAALAALALVSIAVVGPAVFFAALPEALRVGSGDATLGHNEALFAPLVGVVAGAYPDLAAIARIAEYALLAALALAVGCVLWRSTGADAAQPRQGGTGSYSAAANDGPAYAVALCAMVLLAPAAWVHHYVWVLPAAALVLGVTGAATLHALVSHAAAVERRAALVRLGVTVLGSCLLAWMLPSNWDTEPHPSTSALFGLPMRPLFLELRPLGALMILIVAATLAGTARTSAAEEDRKTL